jgi:Glyoxalase-like domain
MHIDLETDNVEAEVERLEALGAVRWDHQQERGFDFWVLQDPWGNEFCILQEEFPELLANRRAWSAVPLVDWRAKQVIVKFSPRRAASHLLPLAEILN